MRGEGGEEGEGGKGKGKREGIYFIGRLQKLNIVYDSAI